jgi:osmotically-inducible protein OsmY
MGHLDHAKYMDRKRFFVIHRKLTTHFGRKEQRMRRLPMFRDGRWISPLFRRLALPAAGLLLIALPADPLAANEGGKQLDDSMIWSGVNEELWEAKAVDANDIDIEVNEGVVTLEGQVDNILSKERAVRIARMTRGVTSVIDKIQVDPLYRTDKEIRDDVLRAIGSDPVADTWKISITVSDRSVTLDGKVESFTEKQLAEKVAKSVRGVASVNNQLSIAYDTIRTDSEIQTEIEQRFAWDARLDDDRPKVEVNDGEVTLSGYVGSDYEKMIARTDAWVTGVTGVDDGQLMVNDWKEPETKGFDSAMPDDEEIHDAVRRAFLYDPRVNMFNPTVSVDNGVVTLTGVVSNLKAKRAAAQDAKNTVGVWRVKNFLRVRPDREWNDSEIKDEVADALLRDPFVNRFDISTTVYDGDVFLRGEVDSYFEKAQAEDVVAKVKGVTDVHNYLDVGYDSVSYGYDFYDWDPTLYDYDFDIETTQRKSDQVILDDIRSELFWSPWVDSDQVEVKVDDGIATLTGEVDDWSEREAATENAMEGGAIKVVNKLDLTN